MPKALHACEALRRQAFPAIIAAAALAHPPLAAADWAQQMGNAGRTAVSTEAPVFPLHAAWIHEPVQPPHPAWPQPGKELHRMDFDYAPQPVIAGGRVFFGSSSDDAIRALDLKSGRLVWRFVTGGPVRFAPAIADGKVYAASDDGCLYCLEAATGAEVWRFQAAPSGDLLLGNERMISRWPLRSGVAVSDGVVYTVAGMWPAEGIHVFALEARTGKLIWRNDSSGQEFITQPHAGTWAVTGVAAQGCLAVAGDKILVPTGRSVPAAFDRRTGRLVYFEPGAAAAKRVGGAWVSTAGDVYFNLAYGNSRLISHVGELEPSKLDGMAIYSLDQGKNIGSIPLTTQVVAGGGKVYGVGGGKIKAYELASLRNGGTKKELWSTPCERAYVMALAGKTVLAGGKGAVTAFDAAKGTAVWHDNAPGEVRGLAVADGCLVATTDRGAIVCFASGAPAGPAQIVHDARAAGSGPALSAESKQAAADILSRSGKKEGCALVLGAGALPAAEALAAQSKLQIIAVTPDAQAVPAARGGLCDAGLNGGRVAVVQVATAAQLPFAPYFADVVAVVGDAQGLAGSELYRALRPCGGAMVFTGSADPAAARRLIGESGAPATEIRENAAGAPLLVRGALPGAGEWRHARADAGQTSVGGEKRLSMPLGLLWFGGQGPDRLVDRHYRAPTPLSVNGRVFQAGENDLIASDAYNGRILWIKALKGAGRVGADKNVSNLVAGDHRLYVVVDKQCHVIEQETGSETAVYEIPSAASPHPIHWGMIELQDGLLIGSCLSAPFEREQPNVSTCLFALNEADGKLRWVWRPRASVPCSGFAIGGGKVFCLDTVVDKGVSFVKTAKPQTAGGRDLVAINLANGTEAWRQSVPGNHQFVEFSQGIVAVDVDGAFRADTGKFLWRQARPTMRQPLVLGDWLFVQPAAYNLFTGQERFTTDSLTGESQPWRFSRSHGCGQSTGTDTMLFFRSGTLAFYDFASGGVASFGGVRPGCGIDVIAAAGLALMPESSSGCNCSYNYQTSVALAPAADLSHETPRAGQPRRVLDGPWFVYEGKGENAPVEQLNLAFGAPADRRAADGRLWLAEPRPRHPEARSVSVKMANSQPAFYQHSRSDKLTGEEAWIGATGVSDPRQITVNLHRAVAIIAPPAEKPFQVDGQIEDFLLKSEKGHARIAMSGPPAPAPAQAKPEAGESDASDDKTEAEPPAAGAPATAEHEPATEPIQVTEAPSAPSETEASAKAADVWFRHDDKALFISIQWPKTKAGANQAESEAAGQEASVREIDSWEALLTDARKTHVLHLGATASGKRYEARDGKSGWNGAWQCAMSAPGDQMALEMAIPYTTLDGAGLDRNKLTINLVGPVSQDEKAVNGATGGNVKKGAKAGKAAKGGKGAKGQAAKAAAAKGASNVDLQWGPEGWNGQLAALPVWAPGRSGQLFNLAPGDTPAPSGRYLVRLRFAEQDGVAPGQRVFDVALQGKPALTHFDIAREAGGCNRTLVKEFRGIASPDGNIKITFAPDESSRKTGLLPIVSGLEITEEKP